MSVTCSARPASELSDVREKLLFQRGILSLLKDTHLFGPLIEQAIEDVDSLLERFPARSDAAA